jgi:hypothetical protein
MCPEEILRQRAKECRVRAEATNDPRVKRHFQEMAATWERLAKEAEGTPDVRPLPPRSTPRKT